MKYSFFIMMSYMSLTYAENVGIVSSMGNEDILKKQDEIINKNFHDMDIMTQLIDKKIQKIEVLRGEINLLILEREEKIICASIKSLKKDISGFKEKIKNTEDLIEKNKIKDEIKTYMDILNEEKSKLKNNQCIEIER